MGKTSENITWHVNQAIIQDAYIKLIKQLQRCPTMLEISEHVNLSIKTLEKHVKDLKFEPTKELMRTLTPDVVMAIAESAKKGSSSSQKLWMQIMEGWTERHELTGKDGEQLFSNMTDKDKQDIVRKIQDANK